MHSDERFIPLISRSDWNRLYLFRWKNFAFEIFVVL